MRKEKEVMTLDSELQFVQMEKFVNDFDKAMNKSVKSSFKKLLYVLLPILVGVVGMIVFPGPVTFSICLALSTLAVTASQIVENRKKYKKKNYESEQEEEKSVDQILEEGIGESKGEEFYTSKYKETVESYTENENDRKYKEALERQKLSSSYYRMQEIRKNFFNNTEDIGEDVLDKEESMIQITKEIDTYCRVYNLPFLQIVNEHWDKFFDILYSKFEEKGIQHKFYNSISLVCKLTLAKALLNKSESMTMADFIDNLYYLDKENNTLNVTFSKKEVLLIQKELLENINFVKYFNFPYLSKNNGRNK